MDDSFDERIACELEALDDIPGPEVDADGDDLLNGLTGLSVCDAAGGGASGSAGPAAAAAAGPVTMLRHSDHVSCEDLLEFAHDGPNARRTSGKARGVDSDEVRIMRKVLGNYVSRFIG